MTCWGGPRASSAGGRMSPPPRQTQGEREDPRLRAAAGGNVLWCRQEREENETGARKRGRAKTRRNWDGGRPGGERDARPGPVRFGPARAARCPHPHCSSGGAASAAGPAGSALGAALHCSTAGARSFPAPFSSLCRHSAPEAQHGAGTDPIVLHCRLHGASSAAAALESSTSCPPPPRNAAVRGGTRTHHTASPSRGLSSTFINPTRMEGPAHAVGAAAVLPSRTLTPGTAPRCVPAASLPRADLPAWLAMLSVPPSRPDSRGPHANRSRAHGLPARAFGLVLRGVDAATWTGQG